MRWLVTGGCGFIGSALVARLVAEGGHAIRVLDDLSVGRPESLGIAASRAIEGPTQPFDGVQLVVGSILDARLVERCAVGVDVLVHLAANTGVQPSLDDPQRDCQYNVVGTLNCLEAARAAAVRRFVFASSGAAVGDCTPPLHESVPPRPVSPYGASKLAGEAYCSAYQRSFGLETVCLRFGNVYGPGSGHKQSVVARFLRQALAGEPLEIYGSGQQTRDFVFLGDLIDAIQRASRVPAAAGEIFQIASSREVTLLELVQELRAVLQRAGLEEPRVLHGEARRGEVLRNYSDTTKARRLLGWRPETDLATGLARTLDGFLAERAQTDPTA